MLRGGGEHSLVSPLIHPQHEGEMDEAQQSSVTSDPDGNGSVPASFTCGSCTRSDPHDHAAPAGSTLFLYVARVYCGKDMRMVVVCPSEHHVPTGKIIFFSGHSSQPRSPTSQHLDAPAWPFTQPGAVGLLYVFPPPFVCVFTGTHTESVFAGIKY